MTDIITSVTRLELATVEFLSYAIIGILMTTALYVYASKAFRDGGLLAVMTFFIVMYNYLNYQFVPFSLAFGLLLLLFMLENRQRSSGLTIAMLVLFVGLTLTHAFVPLFFVLYLLVQCILKKNKQYGMLCLTTSTIYLVVEFSMAPVGFASAILNVMSLPTEYNNIVKIYPTSSIRIDTIAQMLSRTMTIAFGVICLVGFVLLLVKRKMRSLDKAIFFTGLIYAGTGVVLYTLGTRAIPIVFIPVSLGASCLFESRFRPYLT
ncbi:MAG TPA: hypothetical protein VMS94_06335, partial [Acidobacteriota bacterium]|nr:hypothetical protein [Acidobacteriota bacterium]